MPVFIGSAHGFKANPAILLERASNRANRTRGGGWGNIYIYIYIYIYVCVYVYVIFK